MSSHFGKLKEDWKDIKEIILYGLGNVTKQHIDTLAKDFRILAIIDNDPKKKNTVFRNIPVLDVHAANIEHGKYKVILMTVVQSIQQSMSKELETLGLKEYEDFCGIDRFVSEWYWISRQQTRVFQMDMAVTNLCSLKCKNCNMFVPYYHNQEKVTERELKESLELFFLNFDYVYHFSIVGGEPFLNKNVESVLHLLSENYLNKINHIKITTNGTVLPGKELVELIKECNIEVKVSDYSKHLGYRHKIEKLCAVLEEQHISYRVLQDLEWKDFGFPHSPCCYKDVEKHRKECGVTWRGLNEKKIYYCNVIWSAEKAGLYKTSPQEYLNLEELYNGKTAKEEALSFVLGDVEKEINFCKLCGGCGADNQTIVPAGIQM